MEFRTYSFRYGEEIATMREDICSDWENLKETIRNISDQDIIREFSQNHTKNKSIASSINRLLRDRLMKQGWASESPIFQDPEFSDEKRWRLDFAKNQISVEVAFNHGEAIAWNLTKPVLASELNHVRKAIQTSIGVIITASSCLKDIGGFDSAVGTYEKHLTYLEPLRSILTVPMVIIGLEAPSSFYISHQVESQRKTGKVILTGVTTASKLR